MRLMVGAALLCWAGTTMVLSTRRWFARRPLTERVRPYVPGGMAGQAGGGLVSVATFRGVMGPLAEGLGDRLGRIFGLSDNLARRLARVHSPVDTTAFRLRQLGWAVGALGAAGLAVAALGLGPLPALLCLLGAPLLAFLVLEHKATATSTSWQRRLFLELPVVAEQIGMLLSAGFSLAGALQRIADRSRGACGTDLARVCGRMRQGLPEADALAEWADLAEVDAVDRLVRVLSLNREATDLGRLIAEEARSVRRDVQRELLEQIERREQQVWVPVTVATLVPGVIFLSVPFLEAMRLFAA